MGRKTKGHPDAWSEERRAKQRRSNERYWDNVRQKLAVGDPDTRRWYILSQASRWCRDAGVPFELSPEDILPLPEVCPILGIPLGLDMDEDRPNNYCVDRIDRTRGFVSGNVVVSSYRAKEIRRDGTEEEHRKVADWLRALTSGPE